MKVTGINQNNIVIKGFIQRVNSLVINFLRLSKIIIICFVVTSLYAVSIKAQDYLKGITPDSFQVQGGGVESVNPYTGNLNVSIPLLNVSGRGNIGYQMTLNINNKWAVMPEYVEEGNTPMGMAISSLGDSRFFNHTGYNPGKYRPGFMLQRHAGDGANQCNSILGTFTKTITYFTFYNPDGSETDFYDDQYKGATLNAQCSPTSQYRGTVFYSTNGEGATFISDQNVIDDNNGYSSGTASGYLKFKNGTVYRIQDSQILWMKDINGNTISFTFQSSPSGSTLKITDSINREINVSFATTTTPYDEITYKGSQGQVRTIRVNIGNLADSLQSGNTVKTINELFPEYTFYNGYETTGNYRVYTSIQLPDNRTYNFKYNSYAEVARINLPTGSATEYDHVGGTNGGPASGVINSNIATGFYRRVVERRVLENGNNVTLKTTYSRPETSNSQSMTYSNIGYVDVSNLTSSNVLLTKQRHYYSGYGAAETMFKPYLLQDLFHQPWNTGLEYQTDTFDSNGTTTLQRNINTWQPRYTRSWGGETPQITESVSVIEPSASNLQSKQSFFYDQYGNVTDTYDYDFGTGAPGAFMRRSHTDYMIDPNYTSYTGSHLRSLATQSWVSSDTAGANKVSLTQIEYDNYTTDTRHAPLLGRSNVSGHDTSNYGIGYTRRGNPTQTVSFGDAANQANPVYSSMQYDVLGNVVRAIDANGISSTVDYDDNFGLPDSEARTNSAPSQLNGQQTFAFPSSATNPNGWTGYAQFDYFTGNQVNAEDINGNISSTFYNDLLDRPTQKINANNTTFRSQLTIVYDDLNRRVQTTSDLITFGDNLAKSEIFYDGLGRNTQARKYEENGGYVVTLSEYDSLGRTKRITNPYRPSINEPQLWTTSSYDALSRIISIIMPDGSATTTAYSGNTATTTDQGGKQRRSITNALEQLVRVDEPDDSGNLGNISNPTQPTYYQYNTIGKMVKVNQGIQSRFFLYDSLGRLIRVRQPEQIANQNLNLTDSVTSNSQWTAGFSYDANGNLLTAIDAKGVNITSTYDNLNRSLTRSYSDGTPTVTYSYDNSSIPFSKGKLTQISNAISTSQILAFDNLGGVLASRQITDGVNYDSSYIYNLSGKLVEETYPSGRKVKNTFENDGDLSKIETKTATGAYQVRAQNLSYTSSGVLEKLQLGNGLWETAQLNSRLQVTQLGLGTSPTDTSFWRMNYDFGGTNNDGNVKVQTLTNPAGVFTQTFQYDSLDRLKQAQEVSNGNQNWVQNFSYDRYGNRIGQNQTIAGQTSSGTPSVDTNTNRFSAGQGYIYDFAGNVVQDNQGKNFVFNGDNKQIEVRDSQNQIIGQYFYDGDSKRVKKVTNTEITIFVYSGGRLIAEYTSANSNPTTPSTQYLGIDVLGSPRVITDQNAQVVSRRDFMPFGEEITNIGGRTEANGYKVDNLRQKFTGYQKDNETGLDFAEARYYNNAVGRFTAVDPLMASGKSDDPQTFNRYAYVMNNPIILSDPTGMQAGKRIYVTGSGDRRTFVLESSQPAGYRPYTGNEKVNATDGHIYRVTSKSIIGLGRWNRAIQPAVASPTNASSNSSPSENESIRNLGRGFRGGAARRGIQFALAAPVAATIAICVGGGCAVAGAAAVAVAAHEGVHMAVAFAAAALAGGGLGMVLDSGSPPTIPTGDLAEELDNIFSKYPASEVGTPGSGNCDCAAQDALEAFQRAGKQGRIVRITNGSPYVTVKAGSKLISNSGWHDVLEVEGRYYDAVTGSKGADSWDVYIQYFQDGDLLKKIPRQE